MKKRRMMNALVAGVIFATTFMQTSAATLGNLSVLVNQLNVRSGPSITSPVLKTVNKGAVFTAYEKSGDYYRIGEKQWVSSNSNYTKLTVPTPPAQTTYTVVSGDTLTKIGTKFKVSVQDLMKWNKLTSSIIKIGQKLIVSGSNTTPPPVTPPTTAQPIGSVNVLVDGLNIRKGPTTGYGVVRVVNRGATFQVYAKSGDYYKIKDGEWISSNAYYTQFTPKTTTPTTPPPPTGATLMGKKIVIDAGHGGTDVGAIASDGTREKDLTLQWSLSARDELARRGANVVMVRDKDVFNSLEYEANFTAKVGADLFISIHNNSYINSSPYGTETYYSTRNPFPAASQKLATKVHEKIVPAMGTYNRGVRDYGYYVLRNNSKPAILIEVGFISNYSDLAKLKSPTVRSNFSVALANGVENYYKQ